MFKNIHYIYTYCQNFAHWTKWIVFSFLLITCTLLKADSCPVSCGSNIQVTLNSQGLATIIPALVLTNYDPLCTDNIVVEVFDAFGVSLGDTVECSEVGQTLSVEITNTTISSTCTGSIYIVDNLSPVIACDTQYISCSALSFLPGFVPFPEVSDNCTALDSSDLSYTDVSSDLDCLTNVAGHLVTGKIERTWSVEDAQGNQNSCVQHIFIERVNINQIVFPQNMDDVELPALACNLDDPYDLSVTGYPSVNGVPLDPDGSCEFVITYNDQVSTLCSPSTFKVIRTWQVIDYCTDEFTINAQIIKVLDKVAPYISCPNNMVIGTNSFDCSATVNLPDAYITDNCSAVIQSIAWDFGTGVGPFYNVPLGTYTVDYTAIDACNNSSDCSMEITIVDDDAPTPICHLATNVALQASGLSTVNATVFDDGSTDNCGVAYFEVSRDGFFGDSLVFDCSDVDLSPIDVTVRVFDIHNLYADVSVLVYVEDNVFPTIFAPNNISLNCEADYTDLSLTGSPVVDDNCGVGTPYYTDVVDLTCGVGTVTRTWSVQDNYGHTSTDVQTITIYDNTPIVVTFPDDVDLYTCGAVTTPAVMGEPTMTGNNCELVAIDHNDVFFEIAAPACYKIYRTWTIINDCVYDPNNPNSPGFWEQIQTISVFDTIAPVLTAPDNLFIDIITNDCEAYVNVPLPTIDDCSTQLTITNTSIYADSSTGDASGTYPTGTHVVKYYVEDGCGNTSNCTMLVVVKDAKPPTAVCNFAISITLENDGTVFLTPNLINQASWDNCTPQDELQISIEPNFLTCEDVGPVEVEMTVMDNEGNTSFCTTTVYVQDNLNVCGSNINYYTAQGNIYNFLNIPEANIPVELVFDNLMQTSTATSGDFLFEDLVDSQSYTLKPTKNDDWRNGVNTFDLIKIGRHILETENLQTPYQYIAADANNNKSITGADVVILRQMILFNTDTLPNNTSWKFIDQNFAFPPNTNPLEANYNQEIIISNISENMEGLDFVSVKMGDVTGDASPFVGTLDTRDDHNHKMYITDQNYNANEEIWIDINVRSKKSSAIQGTMWFDINELDILGVYNVNKKPISGFFGLRFALDGYITFSVDLVNNPGLEHFYVRCKTKENGRLSNSVALNDDWTKTLSFDDKGQAFKIDLVFGSLETNNDEVLSLKAFPNPFSDVLNITITQNEKDTLGAINKLEVYNAIGQLILQQTIDNKHIDINTSQWTEGVFMLIYKENDEIIYAQQLVKVE